MNPAFLRRAAEATLSHSVWFTRSTGSNIWQSSFHRSDGDRIQYSTGEGEFSVTRWHWRENSYEGIPLTSIVRVRLG